LGGTRRNDQRRVILNVPRPLLEVKLLLRLTSEIEHASKVSAIRPVNVTDEYYRTLFVYEMSDQRVYSLDRSFPIITEHLGAFRRVNILDINNK
jgi:hypothetical protein